MGVESSARAIAPQDRIAFGALIAFVVVMYTIPSLWIEALAPLRLALTSSALAAGLMLIRKLGHREPFFLDGLRGLSLILFGLLALGSLSWSIAPEVTRHHGLEILKLVAIYLTMVNVVTTPKRLVIFAGAMVLASVVTSWNVIDTYNAGIDLVEGYRARWIGVYADPNHMAMDVGLIIPLAIAFIANSRSKWWMRVLCAVAAGLAVTSVVISYSRGGFLGLSAAVITWAVLERTHRMKALALGTVLFIGLAIFAPETFWARNETVTEFEEDASAMGRVYAWEVASKMSTDNPLVGVGAGGFRYAWPLYAPPEAHAVLVAHNVYLDVVGELGFIGLLLFLLFTGGAAGGAFRAAQSGGESAWIMNGVAASLVGYVVCSMFSGYTLSAHFYVLFGMAACAERVVRLRQGSTEASLSSMRARGFATQPVGEVQGG